MYLVECPARRGMKAIDRCNKHKEHIKEVEKDKEIERLNKELDTLIEICNNKQKEIVRLNNIINELEYYLEKTIIDGGTLGGSMVFWYKQVYNYLKELKEGK